MSRSTTAREALVAELIGDVADLLNRVESLTTTMDKAREAMTGAKWALAASVEPFQHQMAAAVEQSKTIAVNDIKRETYEFAVISMQRQKEAMTECARVIVSQEVSPPVRELAETLRGLVHRADRPWRAWLTHGAAVFASAAGTTFLLVHFFGV
jgi:hypothetical protein